MQIVFVVNGSEFINDVIVGSAESLVKSFCPGVIIIQYTPVPLMRVALVGEVGYNVVVPWIPNFFPLNVQFPHSLVYKLS